MSIFVYVSHTDPVDGILATKELMVAGCFPFMPQLNKLIVGRSDEEWVRYYRNWILKCDVTLGTKSQRKHEIDFARENHIPVAFSVPEAIAVKLPPFGELGRRFGETVAANLPSTEDWRQWPADDVKRAFEQMVGLGRNPIDVAVLALKAWDRQTNG